MTPLGEYAPTVLTETHDGAEAVFDGEHAPCLGLCPIAAQPGPHPSATVDPSARLFITFNEPIKKGPCFDEVDSAFAGPCEVKLTPLIKGKGEFVLREVDSELIFAGETLALKPKHQLQPFTNYTVTFAPRTVQSVRGSAGYEIEWPTTDLYDGFSYWFRTGPPRGSQVILSIAVGCYDTSECQSVHPFLQAYS